MAQSNNETGTFWIDEDTEELVLIDDDSEEQRFYIEQELEVAGNKYLILIPSEESDYEDDEALVLKLEKQGQEEILSVIEDDDEFNKVRDEYMSM